ncbi:TetR/AcrR family transcriptional regulator [Mycolicibacterium gilvum]|uniref:TetR family transcriptional regulator n=1 Tax=Mycolicibacterium gilvum TaxID=1804 RepID=A0A378SW86_9MYCO|nr:TetR/AcrR family transcriptional regulator [Mycolicibacterium gilvum]MCV7056636.1 TetR/AcrR family transcriptional regulator [Mycolicibacterium gilvum]STZ46358.1 TetR family transcriptional regulator [Mycolicibacterium gilvum]
MDSGRRRLIDAGLALLTEQADREPSTRELYEAAGVAAPTLYHHFGTKEGLLEAVVTEAFSDYLERKRAVPDSGDPVADFAAGWDMHIEFGVQNPVLYRLMFGQAEERRSSARDIAETELRRRLQLLADEGLLRIDVDDAVSVTTGMAFGCVTQLIHSGGDATSAVAQAIRHALITELTGSPVRHDDPAQAARQVLAGLGTMPALFTPAEEGLLRQWLRTVAEHLDTPAAPRRTRKKGNR